MRPVGAVQRLLVSLGVVLGAALGLTAPAAPAHADDPPWSPAGFTLVETAGWTIDGDDRCDPGERWRWAGDAAEVAVILVPCTNQPAAQAAAAAQVIFTTDLPDERTLDVEHVSWSETEGVALRVWVQEARIVVLAVQAADRANALALGAQLAPDLAASLPGEPVPPQSDGYQVQGILVTLPLLVWLVLVLPARAVVALRRPRYEARSDTPGWLDVTPAAAQVATRRRWRRAGWWVAGLSATLLAFGLGNLTIGAVLDGVGRVVVGALGLVGGVVMVRRHRPLPVERAGRLPSTHGGARAWLGRGLSAVAHGLALAVVVGVGVAGVASAILPPAQRIPTPAEILAAGTDAPVVALVAVALLIRESMLLVLLGVLVVLVAVAGLDALGRRLRAASLREVLEADPRPPVLYLRSFDEDRLALPATLHRRGLMDTLNVVRRRRFEEAVVVQLQRIGPVVAIAPPGSRLPRIGAARASYGHDEWQEKVTELAGRAAVVVLSATPDSVREGFGWEIDLVAHRLPHGRVMVVVGPWRGELRRRWEAFRQHVAALPFFAGLARPDLPDGLLVAAHTGGWGWCAWGATRRTDVTYAVAIDHALHALAPDMAGIDDDPDAVDPLLATAG
ncbi:hypothetical protein [Actinotalea caeni]|uniref:hypothetical protein n=1 Tax=Actinotalea caeni TaxID=1348467 RepID=UPI001390C356|nr:hypothetical protein [Actinotalea caeni]